MTYVYTIKKHTATYGKGKDTTKSNTNRQGPKTQDMMGSYLGCSTHVYNPRRPLGGENIYMPTYQYRCSSTILTVFYTKAPSFISYPWIQLNAKGKV